MDQRYRRRMAGGDHDEPQSSSENGASDSPLSGDDNRATAATTSSALSPKKGRRSIQKRVVSVRIGDVEGGSRSSSSKGDAYPPSDSWAWRKYGQKPIKGSPYPRGYYRCSSSKGCPARKQVERSRVDPTTLLITYASEHNHPIPAAKHHHSVAAPPAPPTPATPETPSPPEPEPEPEIDDIDTDEAAVAEENIPSEDRKELLACAAELGLGGAVLMDFSWLADVVKEAPSFVGPIWDGVDDVSTLPMSSVNMREEDESLFADLDELPDCLAVFRNRRGTSTCSIRAAAMHT